MDSRFEDILQLAIERLAAGEAMDDILQAYPAYAEQLKPLLAPARDLVFSPPASAGERARAAAFSRMLAEVASARNAPAARGGSFSAFRSQPAFRAAALAGAVALFGAASLGAAAATGSAPEPVRQLFGFSGDSSIRVEFEGIVQSVDTASGVIEVAAGADVRLVIVTPDTELSRGGDAVALADFAAGMTVEVKGRLRADNAIIASRVHLEDDADQDDDGGIFGTPTAGFDDDDDGDDGDNSGPGGNDDDGSDDDSSGPGGGDDDDDIDDNSGPGVDDDFDENSGPGGGDDDADDTPEVDDAAHDGSSGSGDDDDDPDETPTPGGDDEHEDDDESRTPEPEDTPDDD